MLRRLTPPNAHSQPPEIPQPAPLSTRGHRPKPLAAPTHPRHSSPMPRIPTQGFALLATLATILLLATLVLTLQTRSQSNLRLMARLTTDLQDQAARDGLHDRLRGLVAEAMSGSGRVPDGVPLTLTEGGQDWAVRVQDVEGLIDVYLAPPDILALLPIDAAAVASARTRALDALQPGERFPTLAMSLARFGIDPAVVEGMVTQASTTGALRIATMPDALRARAPNLPPGTREGEQVTHVTIAITRAP